MSNKCVGILLNLKKFGPRVTENFGHLYRDGEITAVVRDLRLSLEWTDVFLGGRPNWFSKNLSSFKISLAKAKGIWPTTMGWVLHKEETNDIHPLVSKIISAQINFHFYLVLF